MRLTQFSDYAFRTLMFVAVKGAPASLDEISAAFDFSRNHLVKAVGTLRKAGFLETRRGVNGGIGLARPAGEINLGDVLRSTEPDFDLVECFNRERNTCPITSCCKLQKILDSARTAFLSEVSAYTLADIVTNGSQLGQVLNIGRQA